jgi:CBS domain-containing protein
VLLAQPLSPARRQRLKNTIQTMEAATVKISQVMTHTVRTTSPEASLQEVARMMAELDAGILPVGEDDKLVGMITDRDVAVRGVAQGKGPDAKVRETMTPEVKYCFEDEDIGQVARNMAEIKVQRLPVMSRDKQLVGIVSLGDIAIQGDTNIVDTAVTGLKEPGGPHTQTG